MIEYRIGDATLPPERPAMIAHVVNDIGAWGAGFSGALSQRYPAVRLGYRVWAAGGWGTEYPFGMGQVLVSYIELMHGAHFQRDARLMVAHLCAQRGVGTDRRRIDYEALDSALGRLVSRYKELLSPRTIHMPRIGCGLAGGRWEDVEPLIQKHLSAFPVYVYDLPHLDR